MSHHPPQHIAIIMDGNGRWAKERFMPREFGHREGVKTLHKIVRYCNKIGLKYLTVYAFSIENWNRSKDEVKVLMDLALREFSNTDLSSDIKIKILGRRENLNEKILKSIDQIQEETKNNSGIQLNIAFNYGGRQEIIDCVKKIAQDLDLEQIGKISEQDFEKYLYAGAIQDPDILIRTGGEQRLSNFLTWESVYSEFFFIEKYWPDMQEYDIEKVVEKYHNRDRRFGRVK